MQPEVSFKEALRRWWTMLADYPGTGFLEYLNDARNCPACHRAQEHARKHATWHRPNPFVRCDGHRRVQRVESVFKPGSNPMRGNGRYVKGRVAPRLMADTAVDDWQVVASSADYLIVDGVEFHVVYVALVEEGEYVLRHHALLMETEHYESVLLHDRWSVDQITLALALVDGYARETCVYGKAEESTNTRDLIQRDSCSACQFEAGKYYAGWKVVRVELVDGKDTFLSYTHIGGMTYKEDEWTTKPANGGPLAVFESRKSAEAFTTHPYAIVPCYFKAANTWDGADMWRFNAQGVKEIIEADHLPEGTVLADKVMLRKGAYYYLCRAPCGTWRCAKGSMGGSPEKCHYSLLASGRCPIYKEEDTK